MNVAINIYGFPPVQEAGAEKAMWYIGQILAHQSHNIHVVTRKTHQTSSYEKKDNIHIHRFPVFGKRRDLPLKPTNYELYQSSVNCIPLLTKIVKTERINVIHGNFIVPTGIGTSIVAKITKRPFLLTVHGGDIFLPSTATNPIRKIVLKNADIITCPSKDLAMHVISLENTIESKIRIIPNGVDVEQYRPLINKRDGKKIVILYVGRLIKRKRIDTLIRALPHILKVRNDIQCIIAGTGPERKELERLSFDLQVSQHVDFLGFVPEESLSALYQSSDIFVNPSLWEAGISLTMLEAMASGIPIVTTRGLGTRLLENNLLYEPENENMLSEKILELIQNKDMRLKIGLTNREIAKTKYSWEIIAKKYFKIYKQLVM